MRDGTELFTAIYIPKDTSVKYPIMMVKTPYGIRPYGEDNYPETLGPSEYMMKDKYIFVYQDARGMFKSGGVFTQMTPHIPDKRDSTHTDNSSDTYDTAEWLLTHLNHHNGRIGLWGISYRGFYASSGIIDAHPAIVCSSPQAPIADWFKGDDVHHNGAFALLSSFVFMELVGQIQEKGTMSWPDVFDYKVKDAYNFFLDVGKLADVNQNYFENKSTYWDSLVKHPDYDTYWQKRSLVPHLKNISPAVMTVGGWFDHENLYGALETYRAIESKSNNYNVLVLGPWIHGGWARTAGDSFGILHFGQATSDFYQKEIEMPFFNHFLKGDRQLDLPEAYIFETGCNTWHTYNSWPPGNAIDKKLFLHQEENLNYDKPVQYGFLSEEYISDPKNPVPYTSVFHGTRFFYNKEYMAEDQRFADSRPDVLTYKTEPLDNPVSLAGPVYVDLYISTNSTDADFVVKLIDVYPDTLKKEFQATPESVTEGYQMLVRGEIMRAKYRNHLENPEPLIPEKIEKITIRLNDIHHCFLKGHRIMLQIQSSWFPLYDRNPQKFMNIFEAGKNDYTISKIKIYHSKDYPSSIRIKTLPSVPD